MIFPSLWTIFLQRAAICIYLCSMNILMKHDMKKIVMAGLVSVLFLTGASAADRRDVVNVEKVNVEVAVGNAPRLPYQLWVTYGDGSGEYRQVRWLNASEATERAEADAALNPVGTEYRVRGFITGDNSTPNGYPVSAAVKVVDNYELRITN